MKINKHRKITIIGVGKVGYALLNKFLDCNYNISFAVEKSQKLLNKIKREQKNIIIKNKITPEIINSTDVIIISVKDDEIETLCKHLKKFDCDFKDKIIFHTSGVLSSKTLAKYFRNKNNIGSLQPVQTFNKHDITQKDKISNSYILLEGGKNFLEYAKKVCKDFNSKFLLVNEKEKRYFHIISVFASNYLTAYFDLICGSKLIKKLSGKEIFDILKPLILTTIDNIDNSKEFYEALSGPIERGDVKTIKKHISELEKKNIVLYLLYKSFGFHTVSLALKKKSIDLDTAERIKNFIFYEK
ncbi:MAG: DUF2520 domain-containing protein [Ignavibacteria bacterium]|nr:DUF2520 domain-containing protein [Ignavibacteria bacterium]